MSELEDLPDDTCEAVSETIDNIKEFAAIIRQMICNENDLTNQRLTWMATLNGLMLTGLGLVWGKQDSHFLIYIFCAFGIIVNISVSLPLYFSEKARSRLLDIYSKKWEQWERLPKLRESRIIPPVIGYAKGNTLLRMLLPWNTCNRSDPPPERRGQGTFCGACAKIAPQQLVASRGPHR